MSGEVWTTCQVARLVGGDSPPVFGIPLWDLGNWGGGGGTGFLCIFNNNFREITQGISTADHTQTATTSKIVKVLRVPWPKKKASRSDLVKSCPFSLRVLVT